MAKAIAQHFFGTTKEWETVNPKLYKAVWGFEETIDGKIFAKLGNGKDKWKSLEYFSIENIKNLPEEFQKIVNLINDEAQARTQADTTLQNNINAETQARQQADTTLQNNINAEIQARQQADTTLQNNIDVETQARQQADIALQNNINTETQARQQADSVLRRQLDEYIFLSQYLISFIESKYGPLGGSIPITTDDGYYLVTDSGDVLVTA